MSNRHPRGKTDQQQRLAERFDRRARVHRIQAHILLVFIILVLGSGAIGFVFANDIARWSLQPQTAETQYAKVKAAIAQNREQSLSLNQQIKEIQAPVSNPFDEKIKKITDQYSAFEDDIFKNCQNIL